MGLSLNDGKTGAIELSGEPVSTREFRPSESLPSGPITWGFLKIGPSGQWIVDDRQVEGHIQELRVQLQSCKSIFAWVQAWNIYVGKFIPNNFGAQANCLGRPHLNMVIEAFGKMQQRLFAAENLAGDSVVAHLRAKLEARFGVEKVPGGFFYFPLELGGLGLIDPLIPLFLTHTSSLANPVDVIDEAFELEEEAYARYKKAFLDGSLHSKYLQTAPGHDIFIDFHEYKKYREETSVHLYRAYERLLEEPRQSSTNRTAELFHVHNILPGGLSARRNPYDEEVLQMYGPEIIDKYGGLAMGEKRLLPTGLLSILQSEKVRWQQ